VELVPVDEQLADRAGEVTAPEDWANEEGASEEGESLASMIESVLDRRVRPQLASHAGDIRVREITADGVVKLEWLGACTGCPLQPVTTAATLWTTLERIPGVTRIDAGWRTSPQVEERLRRVITANAPLA
jgi:Fe-S cluster biogenesis protein NfuA